MTDTRTVGFIDIGTNSIHLLVSRFFPGSLGTPIFHDRESVRLGQNLFSQGFIDEETIEKTRLVIANFSRAAKEMGADEIMALATSAAREAYNRSEILDAVSASGIELRVISGEEEAKLTGLGVFGPYGPSDRRVLIDIGGGSTEINLSKGTEVLFLDSLKAGSVRFSFGLGVDQHSKVSPSDYASLCKEVNKIAKKTVKNLKGIGFDSAVGSSGTMMNLAEMCAAGRDGDASYMTLKELSKLMKRLCNMTEPERRNVPGINAGRSDIIIGGGAIAEELMTMLEIEKIHISDQGLREGMQISYLLNKGHKEFNIRDSSVNTLAMRCGYNPEHSTQVRNLALQFFDGMKEQKLHKMDDNVRELLGHASTLHDIGEFISYNKHHIHTYTILTNSNLPGFDAEEIEAMALMARFHHKRFPTAKNRYLRNLSAERSEEIRMCALMLRMADVLDRHRTSPVEDMEGKVTKDSVILELTSVEDINMEIWKLEELSDAFKDVFGRDLKICASGWGGSI